jgi:hypothetical protein
VLFTLISSDKIAVLNQGVSGFQALKAKSYISPHMLSKYLKHQLLKCYHVLKENILPRQAHCNRAIDLPPGAAHMSRTFSPSLNSRASTGRREAAFRR